MPRQCAEQYEEALRAMGLSTSRENVAMLEVMHDALEIFEERSESYGEVWKQYGALNNLVRGATKVDRLMECWWHNPDGAEALRKDGLDDAFDAINYMVFFIRQARWGNLTGQKVTRPTLRVVE